MALMPQTEHQDERLEEIMPEKDLLGASDILIQAQELDDLTPEQRELLAELFDELEVAHDSLVKASSTLGRLLRILSGKQLLTVLKASIHPLIQINALENLWKDPAVIQQKAELLEDTYRRVKLTMILDPMTEAMRHESINKPNMSVGGHPSIQNVKEIWWWYNPEINAGEIQCKAKKQLSLYITSTKYLGGMDRKALAKKWRATNDEPEPSTSK